MPRRRAIRGLLDNFLGTYTSRYSDYHGYWLFGFLVGLDPLEFDLLNGGRHPRDSALAMAEHRAVSAFREQAHKAGFTPSSFRQAHITITTLPGDITSQNHPKRIGHHVRLVATAVSEYGRTYEAKRAIFAAPHNPRLEWRGANT